LEQPITLSEINQAINSFAKNKSPGPDGYNAEFYQEWSGDLSPLLLQMYQASYENVSFSPLFNHSHITLIHKKGKDPLLCKNYRPTSLANLDNKILAKVLAAILFKVIRNHVQRS
uniref:Reverse transcriptase domain-containing protein n=1 Tax=Sparus aurata TaxID=8175 RepID=A0A671UJT3_SPAAU